MSKSYEITQCYGCSNFTEYGSRTCDLTGRFISDPNKIDSDCRLPDYIPDTGKKDINAEMLAVLKELTESSYEHDCGGGDIGICTCDILDKARNIVAKAEGKGVMK